MSSGNIDIQSRFINALRTQASHHKAEPRSTSALLCPYVGHRGRVFQSAEQLLDHARTEHSTEFKDLASPQARAKLFQDLKKLDRPTETTAGDGSTRLSSPDIAALSLDPGKEPQTSPPSGRKRRADFEFHARKEKAPSQVEVVDPDCSTYVPFKTKANRSRPHATRSYNSRNGNKDVASPHRSATEHLSGWPGNADPNHSHTGPSKKQHRSSKLQPSHTQSRQPGLIELQKYDPRFPELLLQPDSRPISQEQLASEVKSIYAGLIMVETKCIHVDRAQAAAIGDSDQELAPDHWQALIALHRTLLHEHHDFFLASQHPSASPALCRLAAKYTMPARMWRHGIHSFLELLRQRLPKSLDYMLAFIYMAYQMMALLYETVPAFEDTWIECLGDLGRYRMAIEDEDIRDRETWASVARSWYSKAADKNPMVGRLYHHLAILARPNDLQQMYYYSRSLTSVETFPSARESIMTTLLGPLLDTDQPVYSSPSSVDTSFITAHAHIFRRSVTERFRTAQADFLNQLDNHIGRVTAKWKEQGVYIAVTNGAGWFDYGVETNTLRLVFELRAKQRKHLLLPKDQVMVEQAQSQKDKPTITDREIPSAIEVLSMDNMFCEAVHLTNKSLSLALHRIGDRNVLPHIHVVLSFFSTLASIEYVANLIDQAPWADFVPFLNTLLKSETQQNQSQDLDALFTKPVFPVSVEETIDRDELPLPEDYLIRGLIWAEEYLPEKWFEREHDDEERYLELASTAKRRAERVLRLGHQLASSNRWLSYEKKTHTFSVAQSQVCGVNLTLFQQGKASTPSLLAIGSTIDDYNPRFSTMKIPPYNATSDLVQQSKHNRSDKPLVGVNQYPFQTTGSHASPTIERND